MDMNSYAMAKFNLESKDVLHSKQKGCWSYLKYFFFFTSIIQSLIILGLVLFMVYSNPHESYLQQMESKNQDMNKHILRLSGEKTNLTHLVNATARETFQWKQLYEMTKRDMRTLNQSLQFTRNENRNLRLMAHQCQMAIATANSCNQKLNMLNITCYGEKVQLREEKNRLELSLHFTKDNCTRNTERLGRTAEQADADKDRYRMDMIALREEKRSLADQLDNFKASCSAIENRFQTELQKLQPNIRAAIDRALSSAASSAFQFGPDTTMQADQLSKSCQALSADVTRQVTDSLNKINAEVTAAMMENSRLKAEKGQSKEHLDECEKGKKMDLQEKQRAMERLQITCDADATKAHEEKEKLKREKEELGRQLGEKGQALHAAQMQLLAKGRELERCVKVPGSSQNMNPMQGYPGGSQNLNDLNEQLNRVLSG